MFDFGLIRRLPIIPMNFLNKVQQSCCLVAHSDHKIKAKTNKHTLLVYKTSSSWPLIDLMFAMFTRWGHKKTDKQ